MQQLLLLLFMPQSSKPTRTMSPVQSQQILLLAHDNLDDPLQQAHAVLLPITPANHRVGTALSIPDH